ncbi:uncharacterized protein BJ212DRAFT_1297122 [Suillus subaureus]|uniref:Uncharacterized protein n=1 Tax=Suillus subaureus TaxID=48587 RepID=A0A9P7JGI2_9AGAM|nr:uncharacterized protein BJ212DRAFT_1297122 [Suillus subaureus]KAG1821811.1 hypothetical protein BJ212DRAFT_1297122 [Suillus subaureus]
MQKNNKGLSFIPQYHTTCAPGKKLVNYWFMIVLRITPSEAYQWGQPSNALIPLQCEHWVELPGVPFYLSHEALLFNFFNEVKKLSCKLKSFVTRGAAVIGNQCIWKAFSRDLIKGIYSPDIILISNSSEKVRVHSTNWVIKQPSSSITNLNIDGSLLLACVEQPFICLDSPMVRAFTPYPKMFSKVINYFTESELSWLEYDTYIFHHPTLQIWDDKLYWLDDEDKKTEGLYGKVTCVFAVKHRLNQTHLMIKDCWDPSEMMSNHMVHKKLQDPAHDPLVHLTPNNDRSLLKIPEEEDHDDCLDKECAEKLDGVYCHVHNLYWDKINSLPGITIMKDHMCPSFGPLSKSPSHMSVTSISAVMILVEDLDKIFKPHEKCSMVSSVLSLDGNSMLLVQDISAKSTIPSCPEKILQERSTCHTQQGTLPFESNQSIIRGPVQFHHDLQSYFWLAYLITCNCAAIQQGMLELHNLFLGHDEKDLDGYGCCINLQLITYESLLLVLYHICDSINPALNLYPKNEELKEAQVHYQYYLEMGNCMPLLVDDDRDEEHVGSKRKAAKTHPDTKHVRGSGASEAGLSAPILLPQVGKSGMQGSKKAKSKAKAST